MVQASKSQKNTIGSKEIIKKNHMIQDIMDVYLKILYWEGFSLLFLSNDFYPKLINA